VTRAVILLQARMASSRLPGKALSVIGTRTLLGHCLARLRAGRAAPVMLATTARHDDDVLADVAAMSGVAVFRGPEHDVLRRFVEAARVAGARYVVRATADNPAVDIDASERVLAHLRASGCDHVSEWGLPYGAAVEGVTFEALERASRLAVDPADREHVTTLIRRDAERFSALVVEAPAALRRPDVRLTVDTPEDLAFMRDLYARVPRGVTEPTLMAFIDAADEADAARRCA
jgi:spore coat polysaccharide biosynthesis protein SpsF